MQVEQVGDFTLYCGVVEDLLPTLPNASVQLIIADPPFCNYKTAYAGEKLTWDRQWPTREAYLSWLRGIAKEWQRVLTPNGSLYCFASPQMAAWVEVTLSETFHILNRITWRKPPYSTKAEMFEKDAMRQFFPASEAILFAEQYGSDSPHANAMIDGNHTYWSACERTKATIFGDYLLAEMTRAQVTRQEITDLFPSRTGQRTGCLSNWLLGYNIPTREQYDRMRVYLNTRNGSHDYLRREYEDLRREYEDLRRPFTVSPDVPYVDVWDFKTVQAHPSKHPCEKPLALMRHMVNCSSRKGDTVLDAFMGSGATLEAAQQCGRRGIGIEQDPHWWRRAGRRLRQLTLFTGG